MRSLRPRALLLVVLPAFMALALAAGIVIVPRGATAATPAVTTGASVGFTPQVRLGFKSGDDWEPAITADRYGHLYTLYKHYDVTGGGTCTQCDLHVLVQRSSDGGHTWTVPRAIAPVKTNGQFDSQIAVDPVDGKTVWASFLENDNSKIAVVKSTDFGETWSKLHIVSDLPPGLDKDTLAVRGNTIAVAYDDNLNTFASISDDGGAHWTTHEIFPGTDRFNLPLSAGGGIDSKGNIFFSWESWDKAHSENGDGPVTMWVTKSSDGGTHWTRTVIDVSGAPPPCTDCGFAFLSAQMTLRVGSDDTVYLLWNGTVDKTDFAPGRIFFSRSTDHGKTYAPRRQVSDAPAGVEHSFPAIATGTHAGDVRIGWMDMRTGAWNLFYRSSRDGGNSWNQVRQISHFVPGYDYITPEGFGLPYGDYFQMVVDDEGDTQIAWGESSSYAGPGNIWASHGR